MEGVGAGVADKVPHLRPIKNKEAQTFICGRAFIGCFKSAEITESKMLIKWRQEMGSVGLLLSCFSGPIRAPPPPPSLTQSLLPHPPPPLSVLLTYIDHNPPRPDISRASGNHHPSP